MPEIPSYEPDKNSSNEPKVNFFEPADNMHGLRPTDETEERRRGLLKHIDLQQKQILNRFPPETDGLDLKRVDGFIESLGLRLTHNITVDNSKEFEVNAYLEHIGMTRTLDGSGLYMAEPDLSFVFRDRKTEQEISPEFTESLIVHELAHGSAEYDDVTAHIDGRNIGYNVPRTGHQIISGDHAVGTFLEEGFCEAVRGKYITDILGHKTGLSDLPQENVLVSATPDGIKVPINTKYETQDKEGNIHLIYSSYAGQAIDMLNELDKNLFPAMIKARKNPDGLREVATRLDNIKPGLYTELRDKFNDPDAFIFGLKHVADLVEQKTTG